MATVLSSNPSSQKVINAEQGRTESRASVLMQNGGAIIFGLLIVYAVGFLPMAAAHNAAHDTRHALAFPCH
ncbi:MAG: CbtB-domain containing protein [Pseudomonadales bacterium]|nr:CbtB-domain containing protein [Pseudomonadales bacterium]